MDSHALFTELFIYRVILNSIVMILLIRVIYVRTYHKRELFFMFFLLNFIVFLLSYLLENSKAFGSFGAAFGLLAAFSLLRLRTEAMTSKDMTYVFIIIAVGLLNAIMKGTYYEILGVNAIIVIVVFLVDGNIIMKNQKTQVIEYDKLEHVAPMNYNELQAALRLRTGLDIRELTVESVDFPKNRAIIKIYYY
ncbi:MAG: DUF4956 domain-containing protein [Cyclobacteriaceae bacterium]|nr:DUF4956 domain-containing protein [Cyclobacteriaceae bacterium]